MIKNTRIAGVEIFRIVAAFAVICIHIPPFAKTEWIPHYKILSYGISHLCRFAVPYFFLASGYFYGKALTETRSPEPLLAKRLKKFLFLFVVWSLVYAFLPATEPLKEALRGGSIEQLPLIFPVAERFYGKFQTIPFVFFWEGNTGHLWFFTALMSAYVILYLFRFCKSDKFLILTSLGLYLFGLLNSNYKETPLGMHLPFIFYFRNGPFCSALFVTLGFHISKLEKIPGVKTAVFLAFFGFLIQECEVFLLESFYHAGLTFDYLAGTALFASGLFLLSLNIRKPEFNPFLSGLSGLTLGIYLSHLIAEKVVSFFYVAPNSASWQIILPLLVFLVSAAGAYVLKKIPFTKIFVT